jgi:hypothetical protein
MGSVIQDIRTAMKTQLDAAGLTTRKYEPWELSSTPLTTLSLRAASVADSPDQKFGWTQLTFDVFVYQLVDANAEQSMAYQDANVARVLTGLGADRTLAGKARWCDIGGVSFDLLRSENGGMVSVATVEVTVSPHPNVA